MRGKGRTNHSRLLALCFWLFLDVIWMGFIRLLCIFHFFRKVTMLATLTIHLHLPLCTSLKEKRGRIKPLISRLHREFNVSVAEMDLQDKWTESIIACAMVSSDAVTLRQSLQTVAKWVESNWTEGDVWD